MGPVSADHAERLDAVMDIVRLSGARRVIDAGCGDGPLVEALAAEAGVEAVLGLEQDPAALRAARARLRHVPPEQAAKVRLEDASIIDDAARFAGFKPDLVALVEVIEHVDPSGLPRLERALFAELGAAWTVATTPNAEFNPVLRVPPDRFRHRDHRFEWARAQFVQWGRRTARRYGLSVDFADIVRPHPELGGSSQMAVFRRTGSEG